MSARRLGRYDVGPALGAGGMGLVTLGRLRGPLGFERTVALKRLHPHLAADPDALTMAIDEARLGGMVQHPGLVPVIDLVRGDGEIVLVSEYVHGPSLSSVLASLRARDAKLSTGAVAAVGVAVLDALAALHGARDGRGKRLAVVHRDVSPHNVIVSTDGVPRLSDFGIATHALKRHATLEGQVKGKAGYMAPEQLEGRSVDARADLYAVGVLLWEMATGQRLFAGDAPRPSRVAAPSEAGAASSALDDVIARALAPARDDRFASAETMRAALVEAARGGPLATFAELATALEPELAAFEEERAALLATFGAETPVDETATAPTAPGGRRRVGTPSSAPPRRGRLLLAVAVPAALVLAFVAWSPWRTAESAAAEPARVVTPPVIVAPSSSAPSASAVSAPPSPSLPEPAASPPAPPPPRVRTVLPAATGAWLRPGEGARPAPSASASPARAVCDPPYVVDADGLKRFRPECL